MSQLAQTAATVLLRLGRDPRAKASSRVKPASLIYSVDEVPPLSLILALGLQHVFVMSVGWIFVVVVATTIGVSSAETQAMICISMIASGIGTILQARPWGRWARATPCTRASNRL